MDASNRRLRIIVGQQDIACRTKLQAIGFCAQAKLLELLVSVVAGLARVQVLSRHLIGGKRIDVRISVKPMNLCASVSLREIFACCKELFPHAESQRHRGLFVRLGLRQRYGVYKRPERLPPPSRPVIPVKTMKCLLGYSPISRICHSARNHLRFRTKYAKPTRREIILVAELNAIPIELLTTELE